VADVRAQNPNAAEPLSEGDRLLLIAK
jgi:hypothetical protein